MFTRRWILASVINFIIFASLLLLPAGTIHWWRVWVFFGVIWAGTMLTMFLVFRDRPDLLAERLRPMLQKGQPLADKILVLVFLVAYIAQLVFIPIDRFHLHLVRLPGVFGSIVGMLLIIAGWWIISLAFKENAYAAPVVKVQSERQHHVIDTGVYSIVRHPMYSGVVLFLIGVALWLESYAAALLAAIPAAILAIRLQFEEAFLKKELPGYAEYTKRVRWRMIPGIW